MYLQRESRIVAENPRHSKQGRPAGGPPAIESTQARPCLSVSFTICDSYGTRKQATVNRRAKTTIANSPRPFASTALLLAGALSLALSACGKTPAPPADSTAEKPAVAQADKPATAESPLAKAVTRGDLEKIRVLLEQGAEVDASDALGRTPLHMAAFYGRPRTTELLLAHGAKLESADRVGMTPLHAAVLGGSLHEVELLIGKGANIEAASDTALTPLHLAAATGQTAIAKLLLQQGASAQKTDKDGKTPRDLAAKNDHPKTLALFVQGQEGGKAAPAAPAQTPLPAR